MLADLNKSTYLTVLFSKAPTPFRRSRATHRVFLSKIEESPLAQMEFGCELELLTLAGSLRVLESEK